MADQVAEILRNMILIGDITPDWHMTQDQLAKMLNVSVTPVREALLKLSVQGLIEASPNRSYRVAQTTPDDVRDIYWQHATLAAELTRRACVSRDEQLLTDLRETDSDYREAVKKGDVNVMEAANWRFHRAINLAARSPRLVFMLKATLRFMPDRLYTQIEGWGERSVAAHAMIVSAIAADYPDLAARAASEHVHEAGHLLIDLLKARGFWDEPAAPDTDAEPDTETSRSTPRISGRGSSRSANDRTGHRKIRASDNGVGPLA